MPRGVTIIYIDVLPFKEQEMPLLLGEKLDCHLQDKILAMKSRGTPIGTTVQSTYNFTYAWYFLRSTRKMYWNSTKDGCVCNDYDCMVITRVFTATQPLIMLVYVRTYVPGKLVRMHES